MSRTYKVALVGAGFIADVHADCLKSIRSTQIAAVVDPATTRAEALARRLGCEAYAGLEACPLDLDVAHILTPPPLHRRLTEQALGRGLHVLVEKPMAETMADCQVMNAVAQTAGRRLKVNQNFVYHPAYTALADHVREGKIGPVGHVTCVMSVPLRQLAAGQLGHWMFQSARNLLLEQAVHPLSQITDLVGPLEIKAVTLPTRQHGPDWADLTTAWSVIAQAENAAVSLYISLGESHPAWRLSAFGTDGVITADVIANRVLTETPGRALDQVNDLAMAIRLGAGQIVQGVSGISAYGLSQLGLRRRNDAFFRSMTDSISHFYKTLDGTTDRHDDRAAELVWLCETIAEFGGTAACPTVSRPAIHTTRDITPADVLVIGGTGFIGRELVGRLLDDGRRVIVMARSVRGLPPLFTQPDVQLIAGDAIDEAAVTSAMRQAPVTVHLAHGGGRNWPEIERGMVGGAELAGRAAIASETRHLIFVSSIAALYLGDPTAMVTATTEADPHPEWRSDYARGKVMSEARLQMFVTEQGLPLTLVRPGVVIGEGTSPFHSGVGLFNRETHCLGWNDGRNPLPLVLVADVADAIARLVDRGPTTDRGYNLVGDVRWNARDYVSRLANHTGRPLRFHPQSRWLQFASERSKWLIKLVGGRRDVVAMSMYDLRSRGLVSSFDTGIEKQELDWRPQANEEIFAGAAFVGAI